MQPDIDRLRKALDVAAMLAEADPVYTPIFARLDAELSVMIAHQDPVARMRAKIQHHNAMASTTL